MKISIHNRGNERAKNEVRAGLDTFGKNIKNEKTILFFLIDTFIFLYIQQLIQHNNNMLRSINQQQ